VRTLTFAMVLSLAASSAGCRSKGPSDFFPASNAVQGWVKAGDTRTFDASHLFEYIDGDAEKYIQAGVVKTLTSDYRFNDKTDATADVFVMAKPEGAAKIFDSEPAAGSQAVTIGEAGHIGKGSLTFHQGPFYVRVVAYEDSPEMTQALTSLGRAISSRLK